MEAPQQTVCVDSGHRQGRVEASALKLDLPDMGRALGYGTPAGGREMPDHMVKVTEEMLARGREVLEPHWVWAPIPVQIDAESNVLACQPPYAATLSIGQVVRAQLRNVQAVAAFVVTIGGRLETEARALMDAGQALEGYVLDTVGSVAVEAAADLLETVVAASVAERGWKITNRFSPGYCTWETGGQHALFSLLPERPAGVSLSDSSLMSPIKSVSGVIGLGEGVKHRPYPCDLCAMTTCHQRLTEARL